MKSLPVLLALLVTLVLGAGLLLTLKRNLVVATWAFVRHAPRLTEAEQQKLASALPEVHHHAAEDPRHGSGSGDHLGGAAEGEAATKPGTDRSSPAAGSARGGHDHGAGSGPRER